MSEEEYDLHKECKDPNCPICSVHGTPPMCGCMNLEIYCSCCENKYLISASSYNPDMGCRDCGCNVMVIHEEPWIQ